jgi:alkylated DNA repair dioxygenase AlkB
LQDASRVEDLLAAATLLVLPAEESAHWHAQSLHRAKRRGAASRALVRLARWLAPESNLSDGGARETCVADARFARLVEAAACAYQEDEDDDDDDDATDADDPDEGQKRPVDTRTDAELELALDAFRALGSLAPISDPEVLANAALIGERVVGVANAREDGPKNQKTKKPSSPGVPPHRASVGAWACARLGLDPASTVATAFRERNRETPFRVLPNIVSGGDGDDGDAGDDLDRVDATQTGGWTSAADILASRLVRIDPPEPPSRQKIKKSSSTVPVEQLTVELLAKEVPFKVEQLVTRDGARVDERRETCWMADEGVGGLAYSGKVMRPTPFTPSVDALRRLVERKTGQRFDCALLNLYPERSVACKYHKDPDLGRLWARDSVIVSLGETRRFAFREDSLVKKKTRAGALVPRSRRGRRLDVRRLQRHVGALRDAGRERRARRRERRERRAARLGGVQAVAGDGKARRRARARRRRRGQKKKPKAEPRPRRRRFEPGARRARERRARERREGAGNERRGRETIDAEVSFSLRKYVLSTKEVLSST